MNQSTLLTRYLTLLLASFLAGSFILPRYYNLPYPKPLGAQTELTPNIQRGGIKAISENKPQMVLIGDSTLYTGVEESLLTNALGLKTYIIAVPGSGSAVWYLILKNIVLQAEHRPQYVVIPFRDTLLTIPNFRTTGHYFSVVDEYAGKNESLLMERAYINAMPPAEQLADGYFPPYSARWTLREGINRRARYSPAAIFLGCAQPCADDSLNSIFNQEGINNLVSNNRAAYDAGILYTRAALDFENRVDESFLPAMIQLARENQVALIFVRMKNLDTPTAAHETPALQQYLRDLETYLDAQENALYLDLAHEESILPEYFSDQVHFTVEGKNALTLIFAERLKILLEQK